MFLDNFHQVGVEQVVREDKWDPHNATFFCDCCLELGYGDPLPWLCNMSLE